MGNCVINVLGMPHQIATVKLKCETCDNISTARITRLIHITIEQQYRIGEYCKQCHKRRVHRILHVIEINCFNIMMESYFHRRPKTTKWMIG